MPTIALSLLNLPFLTILWVALLCTLGFLVSAWLWVGRVKAKNLPTARKRNFFSKLLYAAFIACTLVLSLTSFGSMASWGHMHGYTLMAHVAVAGAFVFLLPVIALLYLPKGANVGKWNFTGDSRWWFTRSSAWGMVLFGWIASATMFSCMLPILTTSDMFEFTMLHRLAGLGTLVCAALHLFGMLCAKLQLR